MRLPYFIIAMMPKSYIDKYITGLWDNKPDENILAAYNDAMDWLKLESGRFSINLPDTMIDSLNMRLETYIIPQMRKRGLAP